MVDVPLYLEQLAIQCTCTYKGNIIIEVVPCKQRGSRSIKAMEKFTTLIE